MEDLIATPKGLKYLVRCLSVLPEHVIEGKGLLNDGADEARADCLHTYSNNAWCRWRDSDDMRGDSRGA
ncbi:hypothetical protein J6590_108149, partial [Homalodisca vitripennis]